MFPIALNLVKIPILLVGRGKSLQRRLHQLEEAGATQITVIEEGLPSDGVIAQHNIIMATALSQAESEQIAKASRAAGKLVNVEDANDLCDFYFTANIRRGDLVIAVSTGGASPTLAKKVRKYIAEIFGAQWEQRTGIISKERQQWKNEGKSASDIMQLSEDFLAKKGWL